MTYFLVLLNVDIALLCIAAVMSTLIGLVCFPLIRDLHMTSILLLLTSILVMYILIAKKEGK